MAQEADVREKCEQFYGHVPEGFEPMLRHYPGVIEGYLSTRNEAFQDPPEGALTWREKYLVLLTIEISHRKVPDTHIRNFVKKYGGTADDVAELGAICLCLAGMITNQEAGAESIRIAEQAEQELDEES